MTKAKTKTSGHKITLNALQLSKAIDSLAELIPPESRHMKICLRVLPAEEMFKVQLTAIEDRIIMTQGLSAVVEGGNEVSLAIDIAMWKAFGAYIKEASKRDVVYEANIFIDTSDVVTFALRKAFDTFVKITCDSSKVKFPDYLHLTEQAARGVKIGRFADLTAIVTRLQEYKNFKSTDHSFSPTVTLTTYKDDFSTEKNWVQMSFSESPKKFPPLAVSVDFYETVAFPDCEVMFNSQLLWHAFKRANKQVTWAGWLNNDSQQLFTGDNNLGPVSFLIMPRGL